MLFIQQSALHKHIFQIPVQIEDTACMYLGDVPQRCSYKKVAISKRDLHTSNCALQKPGNRQLRGVSGSSNSAADYITWNEIKHFTIC